MASKLPVKTSQLKAPDEKTIEEMIHVYQAAFKNDQCIQLKYTMPDLMERMAGTIANNVKRLEYEFITARNKTNDIIGWLALAFKLEDKKRLSEEHVLLTQYTLLPDIVVKGKSQGIGTDEMKSLAHSMFQEFKDARERHLPDTHCLLCTLVVDPEYQTKGVASTLLSKAISLCEAFSFPIWVQAPEACQSLFERHLFEEVGDYQLDLNEFVPKPDKKGKAVEKTALGTYVWKFMVRKEPLEQAIQAYRSSKVFAETEADQRAEKALLGKGKEPAPMAKDSAEDEVEPGETEPLLGKNKASASAQTVVAPSLAGEGPSTPLLTKPSSKANRTVAAGEKVVGNRMSS
ncbi:MAG: hypothetical protein ALECFALPRED_003685 [Alectoria fallacina]|uniref:N-acetyltransferase domain-containing protein n=1 Tax=Alectoria fallacina TaxID=1903189 RepID=A0A8H3IQ55_9LECA|nr:MAG: hypothetical protein ALECFALPRED_003685 [Alectoria fallacina]